MIKNDIEDWALVSIEVKKDTCGAVTICTGRVPEKDERIIVVNKIDYDELKTKYEVLLNEKE